MKGLSTWLFSKVVMLVFLVSTFAIMTGVLAIVKERSFADSAEALAFQIKDAFQGVISTSALSSQKVVPIPERLPDDVKSASPRTYRVEITAGNGKISTAVAWQLGGQNKYVASSLLYYSGPFSFTPASLAFNSDSRYLVISKKMTGAVSIVCIKACNKTITGGGFAQCTLC
ncbi:MAG: hypothetical protein QXO69_03080 [archaeon]